jgi:hypothetical protein
LDFDFFFTLHKMEVGVVTEDGGSSDFAPLTKAAMASDTLKDDDGDAESNDALITHQTQRFIGESGDTDAPDPLAPNPTLITPDNGPENGGTRVVITGERLGRNATDITSVVLVTEPCVDVEWTNSTHIACTSGPKEEGGKGSVVITTLSGGISHSDLKCAFDSTDSR